MLAKIISFLIFLLFAPLNTYASNSNVGIGTTVPQAKLDVEATGNASAIIVPQDTTANRPSTPVNGMLRYNTTTATFETYANNAWGSLSASQWITNGANIYYPSGNVGIGTTNPATVLDVHGNSSAFVGIAEINTAGGTSTEYSVAGTETSFALNTYDSFNKYGSLLPGAEITAVDNGNEGDDLSIRTRYASPNFGSLHNKTSTLNEVVRITGLGKVGIGITSPVVTLDVAGGIRAGGTTLVTSCGSGQANGEGTQRYNYTTHNMEYCNGTSWTAVGGGGFSSCTTVSSGTSSSRGGTMTVSVSCAAGYTMTGGGCLDAYAGTLSQSYPSAANTWQCESVASGSDQLNVYAICCH